MVGLSSWEALRTDRGRVGWGGGRAVINQTRVWWIGWWGGGGGAGARLVISHTGGGGVEGGSQKC